MPESNQRQRTWHLIRHLHLESPIPWFLGGDFNEILSNSEKTGGILRGPRHMNAFNSTLIESSLVDMGYEGFPYTWSNGRIHFNTVRCRLDRVRTENGALTLFPSAHITHIDQPGSNHIPICFSIDRPN